MAGVFWYGSAWDGRQRAALLRGRASSSSSLSTSSSSSSSSFEEGSATDVLNRGFFFFSLGSFGERPSVCSDAHEGEALTLTCPYGVVTSVRAFYGDPRGSCSCPAQQRPDYRGSGGGGGSGGTCPEAVHFVSRASGERVMDRCAFVGEGRNGAGSGGGDDDKGDKGEEGVTEGYCLRGSTLFGEACCAQRLAPDLTSSFYSSSGGESGGTDEYGGGVGGTHGDGDSNPSPLGRVLAPDLSSLVPRDRPGCRSDTAQHILQGLCLGRRACNITVNANRTVTYPRPRPLRGQGGRGVLPCSATDGNFSAAHACRESLGGAGNWSGCPALSPSAQVSSSPAYPPYASLSSMAGQRRRRLVVYAQCTSDKVTLPVVSAWGLDWLFSEDQVFSRASMATCLTVVDAAVMLLVLLFLRWLEAKENEEASLLSTSIARAFIAVVCCTYDSLLCMACKVCM